MTSKEAIKTLNKIADHLTWSLALDTADEIEKCVNSINQDLEILEIIKQKAKGNRFFKGCLLRMFQEDGEKKTYLDNPPRKIDKNYYKIKEWLEDEKNNK